MDPFGVGLVILLAIGLVAVAYVAVSRGAELSEIRHALGAAAGRDGDGRDGDGREGDGRDPPAAVRRLRGRLDAIEESLSRQQRDAAYLAEIAPLGIVRIDSTGRVEAANAAAHRFLGRAPGSMTGRPAFEAFVDSRIEAIVRAAGETGTGSGEVATLDADGPTLAIRAYRSALGGSWVLFEDVGELRRLQRIRAEFIDNLSHELRTPLTTVGLLAETLTRDAEAAGPAIPAKMRERVDKIEVETGHLVQMVSELLDLSRIESGRAPFAFDDLDLGRLAVASTERLRLFGERQGVRLSVEAPADLPPVRGDDDRLGQALVNLLHNAVKFSSAGGEVVVRVRSDGNEVVVSVSDEGIGIATADQARIFERFYKVDRARVRGGGTGLGLAIVRHVVEGHGGRVWVESEEGRGSNFSFALPVAATAGVVVGARTAG